MDKNNLNIYDKNNMNIYENYMNIYENYNNNGSVLPNQTQSNEIFNSSMRGIYDSQRKSSFNSTNSRSSQIVITPKP